MHSNRLDVVMGLKDHFDLEFALGSTIEGDALWSAYRDREIRSGFAMPQGFGMFANYLWPQSIRGTMRLFRGCCASRPFFNTPLGLSGCVKAGTTIVVRRDWMNSYITPPLSSEMLLHPSCGGCEPDLPTFLRLPPSAVVTPASCQEVERNTVGELGVRIWLQDRLGNAQLAARAAEGWRWRPLGSGRLPGACTVCLVNAMG